MRTFLVLLPLAGALFGGETRRLRGLVRFRFALRVASLYSFWVFRNASGTSGGYLAAGGSTYRGLKDE